MWAIHDTPWTQAAIVGGLLHLYRRSGRDHWLEWALRLADAQCARQEADGRFRWAGHEDDRFSSLVHNALADCALLDLAAVLRDRGDAARRNRYLGTAERNLQEYVVGRLFRPGLRGFAMNPTDYYAYQDRFILNMNAVAVEALIKLDRHREADRHAGLVRTVAEHLGSLWSRHGVSRGSLPYSDREPDVHVPLYTALTLRGLPELAAATGDPVWPEIARGALAFLGRMEDPETGLWYHKVEGERVSRFPMFVAGAGLICSGILDAARVAGCAVDANDLARRLLRYQYPHGAIRNFIGYDHPDNGRPRGSGKDSWEDVYPTPNWNAQAFQFLCQILSPPESPRPASRRRVRAWTWRYGYAEGRRFSAIVGTWPPDRAIVALYVKRFRRGLVVPGPHVVRRATARRAAQLRSRVAQLPWARAARSWVRRWTGRPGA